MSLNEATVICDQGVELNESIIASCTSELLDSNVDNSIKEKFLTSLLKKNETSQELALFAKYFLRQSISFPIEKKINNLPLFDCCGTGGTGWGGVNISTGIMFILATGGIPVVKHGNRAMSKKCGSADVLENLGIRTDMTPEQSKESLESLNLAFLYAPVYHPAFKKIADVRKTMSQKGLRTIFNLLGPLLNPANPQCQMVGVAQPEQIHIFSEALQKLGRDRHLVIYGEDTEGNPIGERFIYGKNYFHLCCNNTHKEWSEKLVQKYHLSELSVESCSESAEKLAKALNSTAYPAVQEMLCLNASAAFMVYGTVDSLQDGYVLSREIIDSGKAADLLKKWQQFSKKSFS
jgi:anthranilate phosphoribosyltransferase